LFLVCTSQLSTVSEAKKNHNKKLSFFTGYQYQELLRRRNHSWVVGTPRNCTCVAKMYPHLPKLRPNHCTKFLLFLLLPLCEKVFVSKSIPPVKVSYFFTE
jgi:hypothetical protein